MKRTKLIVGTAAVAIITTVVVACGGDNGDQTTEVNNGTAIQHVTVVNTRDGSLTADATVVVSGTTIQRIITTPVRIDGTAQTIDGSGKFVVPGFLDMHTHAAATLAVAPSDFPVLLANGITGIREASGSATLLQTIKQQNTQVLAGTVAAPEVLIMPSSIFVGVPATDAGARQFVRDRIAEGADYIKMTNGPHDTFLAVIDEANKQGKTAAGHLVPAVSAVEASNAGYHSFEHLGSGLGLLIDCATDEAIIRPAVVGDIIPPAPNAINPRLYDGNKYAQYYQHVIDTYSDAKCQSLAQTFVKNNTWQTVTLIRLKSQDYGNDPAFANDPNLKYVDKTRLALWQSIEGQYAATITPSALQTLHNYYALQLKVTKLLQQAGVKILAGTDLGGGWVIPGFSLHQEFKELAAAGLTPLQILQATTLNGAQFVGRESTMGTVEAGKNADLVLLDANPIADVANLDKVSAVFLKGKYYSRAALDNLLSNTVAAYSAGSLRELSTALDPTHPD